uniref:Transposase n=1 Tax=Ralstonia solanacearum TaxID=305 RepID=A0A0S4X9J5_RALSL
MLTDVKQPAKPKLNEVLRLIACLGGFLGRKGDGEPGAKAIWLGLKEVHVAAKTLHALRAGGNDGSCV